MRSLRSVALILAAFSCTGPSGTDGKPCTVKDNGDNTATVTCPDGTTVTVRGGSNGTDGTNGTNGADGSNGVNGTAGTSCTLIANPDAGTKVISCTDGTAVTLFDGKNGVDANAIVDFTKMTSFELTQEEFAVTVQSVSNVARPVARFTVKTAKGAAVKAIPPDRFGGIALLQLDIGTAIATDAGNGSAVDVWVSHIAGCSTCVASSESAAASSLVDNGDGTYAYTFVKDVINPGLADGGGIAGTRYDANAVHRFGLRFADPSSDVAGNRVNVFRPVDVTYDYVPATGANVDGQNDRVNVSNCLTCHVQFRAGALNAGGITPFHGGQRYDPRYCVVCHNAQRKFSGTNVNGNPVIAEPTIDANGNMTPPAGRTNISVLRGQAILDLPVFLHKIHGGEHLTLKGNYVGIGTEVNEFNFPQDIRNCAKCHSNAAKADNWKQRPNRRTCGACHDNVDFATGQGHGPGNLPMPDDRLCNICHDEAFITSKHLPVALPDPANSNLVTGGNANTNASFIGDPKNAPPGARSFQYDVVAVTVTDGGATGVFPQVKFRFTEADAGVAFNAWDGGNELIDGFVGGPSVYCVFAMPQDGISQPADFNASMSAYLRTLWTSGALTGPDSQGYYLATLTSGRVPAAATMLTCGLGYTYALTSTMPLTQTNLTAYPYVTSNRTGGLSMPAKNQWRVAAGYTGRRGATSSQTTAGHIVEASRCANCHNNLGVTPNYHAGQRNDAATCAFCHTQNKTSSGWTAGSESFLHAIHAAKKRTVPFNWHAVGATEDHPFATGFWGVEYPGRLNSCESCHNPGMYDFSSAWYTEANLGRRLLQTVATGVYDAVTPTADGGVPSLALSVSPYVVADGGVNYGVGYAYNLSSQATTQAAASTLVISPIANNCFGCHDGTLARQHMENNGGTIYGARTQALGPVTEQCILCHGPGRTADVKMVHSR